MTGFFLSVDASAAVSFPSNAQVVIPFEPLGWYLSVPSGGSDVAFSTDGTNVHGVVEAGTQKLFQPATVQKLWLKNYTGTGTAIGRITAFTT